MDRFLEQLAASDNELSILNIYVEEIHRLSAENERLRGLILDMATVFDEYARDEYVPDVGLGHKYRALLEEEKSEK